MQKLFRLIVIATAMTAVPSIAMAGELVVRIADGRATVIARDVPLNQILAEWARVGNTRVVNGEKLLGEPVTLELVDMPEKQALDILLRSAAGYMTAPRGELLPGASLYDRVVILATSTPPANPPPMPQPFNRQMLQQMVPQPLPDHQDDQPEPADQAPVPPPGMNQPTMPFPASPEMNPANPPAMQQPQAPVTSPVPGMLPQQPQPTPVMPYAPVGRPYAPPAAGVPVPQPPAGAGGRQEGGP